MIVKRGCRYHERIINETKSSVPVNFSTLGAGKFLPCYIVYKAKSVHNTWTLGAPKGIRFNHTQSGWFNVKTFEDWVETILVPYFKHKDGKKVAVGDNLSAHLSPKSIRLCQQHNIHFVFLPLNSTHLTQPLPLMLPSSDHSRWPRNRYCLSGSKYLA